MHRKFGFIFVKSIFIFFLPLNVLCWHFLLSLLNVLWSKGKCWLAWNQDNVSESNDMSTCGQLFHWASTIKIQFKHVGLEQSGNHHHFIKCNLFLPWYSWKIAHLVLNQQSLQLFKVKTPPQELKYRNLHMVHLINIVIFDIIFKYSG